MNKLEEMLPFIQTVAKSNYEGSGHLLPVLFLNTKSVGVSVVGIDIPGNDFERAKEAISNKLSSLIAQGELYEFIFLSEAWMVIAQDMNAVLQWRKIHGTLEGCPGYMEVLNLMYGSVTTEIVSYAKIENKMVLDWDTSKQSAGESVVQVPTLDLRFSGLWARQCCGSN